MISASGVMRIQDRGATWQDGVFRLTGTVLIATRLIALYVIEELKAISKRQINQLIRFIPLQQPFAEIVTEGAEEGCFTQTTETTA